WRRPTTAAEVARTGCPCVGRPGRLAGVSTPFRILVVCTGNICRSPMAEIVLRDRLDAAGLADVVVDSAAVTSGEVGSPVDHRATAVLSAQKYVVPMRAARQVEPR